MSNNPDLENSALARDEIALAGRLVAQGDLSQEALAKFLEMRVRSEKEGKEYLGDILVRLGFAKREDVDRFFEENNRLYLDFVHSLIEEGYLAKGMKEKVLGHKDAKQNVVQVIDKLGVMTKESFTKLFSKRVNALRLGDWLLARKIVSKETLADCLEAQKIYRLDDYLAYHRIVSNETIDLVKQALGNSK